MLHGAGDILLGVSVTEREALATAVEQDGWTVTPSVVPEVEVDQLIDQLGSLATTQDNRGGIRNLLDVSPAMCALAASSAVRSVAEAVMGPACFAVRALLFDKTPEANWKVV